MTINHGWFVAQPNYRSPTTPHYFIVLKKSGENREEKKLFPLGSEINMLTQTYNTTSIAR